MLGLVPPTYSIRLEQAARDRGNARAVRRKSAAESHQA